MRFLKRRGSNTEPGQTATLVETKVRTPAMTPAPVSTSAPLGTAWADPSWLGWQTLTYSGSAQIKTAGVKHHEADLRALAARHGNLVMAELWIEEEGQYAGAVRVYVGGVQLGSIPHGLAQEFREVIARLAGTGQPARCRALLDAEPGGFVDVWLCAKPCERKADDPFLPPTLGERLVLTADVIAYLDEVLLGTRAKSKQVVRTGELVQQDGRWRVVLDGHDLGPLPGASYPRLDQAQAAGFPVTCQIRVLRQPDRPVRVEADFPTA